MPHGALCTVRCVRMAHGVCRLPGKEYRGADPKARSYERARAGSLGGALSGRGFGPSQGLPGRGSIRPGRLTAARGSCGSAN